MHLSAAVQVISAADEVADSVDRDELAKYFAIKSEPEDEEAEVCILLSLPLHLLFFFSCFLNFQDSWRSVPFKVFQFELFSRLYVMVDNFYRKSRRRWKHPVIN